MKKFLGSLSIGFLVLFIGFLCWAQVSPTPFPTPLVGGPAPDVPSVILSLMALVQNWKGMGIYALIASALYLLIQALKSFGLFDKLVPQKYQALVVLLVGVAIVGVGVLASGGNSAQAFSAAISSSGFSMLLHELIQDFFPPAAPAVAVSSSPKPAA